MPHHPSIHGKGIFAGWPITFPSTAKEPSPDGLSPFHPRQRHHPQRTSPSTLPDEPSTFPTYIFFLFIFYIYTPAEVLGGAV
ncbi:Hypothetical protein FKW44_006258 [Caligus rogercresseyi]|uniref:Uncharacterized protein n=1 Tax=Caligus rogercresseyi TaxID=217165 RepID=A0A7T8KD36_CALRO|nr:Hypothetical protein FKW44_006258 [Caligus rogercresseyi]